MLLDTFKYTLIESTQQSLEVGITISTFIYRGRMMTVLSFYQLWVSTLWKTILLKLKMSEWPSVGKVWDHTGQTVTATLFFPSIFLSLSGCWLHPQVPASFSSLLGAAIWLQHGRLPVRTWEQNPFPFPRRPRDASLHLFGSDDL